jgi:hypothetical protein
VNNQLHSLVPNQVLCLAIIQPTNQLHLSSHLQVLQVLQTRLQARHQVKTLVPNQALYLALVQPLPKVQVLNQPTVLNLALLQLLHLPKRIVQSQVIRQVSLQPCVKT